MKYIIHVQDDIKNPIIYIKYVIDMGLISSGNTCYCHATKFPSTGVVVSCDKNKTGFTFRVWKDIYDGI